MWVGNRLVEAVRFRPPTGRGRTIAGRMASLYERIGGRRKLGVLVRNFYSSLQLDPVLGPTFAEHVKSWPEHYRTLTDFWSVQTGGPSEYRGRLSQAHGKLHLQGEDYERWLAQWRQSCRLHFGEPEAREMIALAENLAQRMPREG